MNRKLSIPRPVYTLLFMLGIPLFLNAQTGSISGRVTDTRTGESLVGANVIAVDTDLGASSDTDGNYTITNVEAGTYTVTAAYIGYHSVSQSVTVSTGAATLDFQLQPSVLRLDGLVVTATGLRRKVELGNSLAVIDAAGEVEERPINNISDLLQSQAAGVQIMGSGGSTGMGSRLRIRGSNSASLSNEPVIYLDGVLINNAANSISYETGGQAPSRLNDINPEDIESIEIIKGPSAATLYGSIAANGVVRIRTKQGRLGRPKWTMFLKSGQVNDIGDYPANYEGVDASGDPCPLHEVADGTCTQSAVNSFQPLNDPSTSPFRKGQQQGLGLSVSGGTEAFTYYISGNYNDDQGVLQNNSSTRTGFRGNFGIRVTDNLRVRLSTGYGTSDLQIPFNDNFSLGLMAQGLNGFSTSETNNGWGEFTPEELFTIDARQNINRLTNGLEADWRPTQKLNFRASGGLDFTSRWDNSFFPTGEAPAFLNYDLGARFSNRYATFVYSVDLIGTYTTAVTEKIDSRTSFGFQYLQNLTQGTEATGLQLVSGSSSIAGAATTTSTENTIESRTVGVFVEEQISLSDKLFLTGALRSDRGSAFGAALDAVLYPKLSASWLISEEAFFNPGSWLNSLRLRAAWGDSGVQPGTNDALRFFLPIAATVDGGQNVTGVTFGGVGNSDLKPERSREIEFGADAELFAGRVGIELTYFNKQTEDALILRNLPPSLGVGAGRFENLGSVQNTGLEFALKTRVVENSTLNFDLDFIGSFYDNELTKLGEGIPTVIINNAQRHAEGYSLGGYWDEDYTFNDANGDGLIGQDEVTVGEEAVYLGSPFATTDFTITGRLGLFGDQFVLRGLLNYRGGQKLYNNTGSWRNGNSNTQEMNDPNSSLEDQARAMASKFWGTNAGYIEDASFWRLREVSLTYNPPQAWASSFGASRLSVTVAGQNLGLWTEYSGLDPEISSTGQSNFVTEEFLSQPPVRMWTTRINITF